MARKAFLGTPFVGYVSLSNGAVGPTAFTLYTTPGGSAHTLTSTERVVITDFAISSNDTAIALVTVNTGGTAPTPMVSAYVSSTLGYTESVDSGACNGIFGVAPKATASAVTAAKTVECVIKGMITTT